MVDPQTAFWDFNLTTWVWYGEVFRDLTNTTLYWTLFHPNTPDPDNGTAVAAWATAKANFIHTVAVDHSMANLKYFCFANEEENAYNKTAWTAYAVAVRAALDAVGGATAAVQLVGTDYFPCSTALDWVQNVSAVAAYSCHNYGGDEYAAMQSVLQPAVAISHAHAKPFFLAEFGGPSQPRPSCHDACEWWDTPAELNAGLVLAEKVLATINLGGQATGYWTFDDPQGGCPYWGLCRWNETVNPADPLSALSCREAHYSHGLLSKFFRGPATVFRTTTPGPDVVASFVVHGATASLAVINLATTPLAAPVVQLPAGAPNLTTFYRYTVEAAHPPLNPPGDLPGPVGTIHVTPGGGGWQLIDSTSISARSLTIYTSISAARAGDSVVYAVAPPTSCRYLEGSSSLVWQPVEEAKYYRVVGAQGGDARQTHVWSTTARTFHLPPAALAMHSAFSVISVDGYGVASSTVLCA
jgi:hypothetical protein